MAKPILDMAKFAFDGETIMSVSELVWDAVIQTPEIASLHTLYTGIKAKKELGFIGEGGLVGKKNQGCSPTPQDWSLNTRKVVFDPESWEVLIHACWADLESSAAVYSLKVGVRVADFTDSDYMAILVQALTEAIKKFFIRLVWFNDKDAAHAPGGDFTAGVDLDYFNLIGGFFKQMAIQVAANPKQLVKIRTEYQADPKGFDGSVQETLAAMYYGADLRLRGSKGAMYLVTQAFADAYAQSLQGDQLETMLKNVVDGIPTLVYQGVPVVPMPLWDQMIAEFQVKEDGTPIDPLRAVLTSPDVLGVSLDAEDAFNDLEIWYDRDNRLVKMEAMGKTDAKLMNPAMFMLAR